MQITTTYVYYYFVSKYIYFIRVTKTEQIEILLKYNFESHR